MASIVIRDLPESVELDRKAMRSISGGKSAGPRLGVVAYRSGFFNNPLSFEPLRIVPRGAGLDQGNSY